MNAKKGWSVQIKRQDGTTFLCASQTGTVPPVWCSRNRKYAKEHKDTLVAHGFKARVVPVLYSDPEVLCDFNRIEVPK